MSDYHYSVRQYGSREIDGYEKEGRLTRLVTPVPMFRDAVVLYATQEKLDSYGLSPDVKPITIFNRRNLVWQNLPSKKVWATCSDRKTIGKLRDKLRSR